MFKYSLPCGPWWTHRKSSKEIRAGMDVCCIPLFFFIIDLIDLIKKNRTHFPKKKYLGNSMKNFFPPPAAELPFSVASNSEVKAASISQVGFSDVYNSNFNV